MPGALLDSVLTPLSYDLNDRTALTFIIPRERCGDQLLPRCSGEGRRRGDAKRRGERQEERHRKPRSEINLDGLLEEAMRWTARHDERQQST